MQKRKIYPTYLVMGAFIVYFALYLLPGLMGIGYSFTDWSSYSKEISFVGFDNFKKIFSADNNYLLYIKNTLVFTVVTVLLKTGLGLAFALILVRPVRFKNFHRAVLFMPSVLSLIVTGLIFRSIYNPKTGLLNSFLRAIGLGGLAQQWLVDPKTAFGAIIAVDVWRGMGYIMVILIAGLTAIPQEYYEAAKIDGATGWQTFKSITVPMLMPSLATTTVLNLIYGLKVFDIVYVLTSGSPVTEVLYTSVFKQFSQGHYGVATALSSLMFVVMAVVGFFVVKIMTKGSEV